MSQVPRGVHLVGSGPAATAEEHFREICGVIPHHIKSIADGETGPQQNWAVCQYPIFASKPKTLPSGVFGMPTRDDVDIILPDDEVRAMFSDLETKYDTWALSSYKIFKELKDEGVIPKHVKFQVCFPTPLSAMILFVHKPYRRVVEPIYEAALMRAVENVQAGVPHDELVIQWDVVQELALLEGVPEGKVPNTYGLGQESGKWWDGPVPPAIIERLVRMMSKVSIDVDMGMHMCYGDYGHKHWLEPPPVAKPAFIVAELLSQLPAGRKLNYFHFATGAGAIDLSFFTPMVDILPLINEKGTRFYIGLVHATNENLTMEKLELAKKAFGTSDWGVAAECGLGRDTKEDTIKILEICKSIAAPWT